MQSIKNYFDDPIFSDLTIRLSDRSINTHRIVLCRKSEYFRTLLTGHFKVGSELRCMFMKSGLTRNRSVTRRKSSSTKTTQRQWLRSYVTSTTFRTGVTDAMAARSGPLI